MLAQVRARFRETLPARIDDLVSSYERGVAGGAPQQLGAEHPWAELRQLTHKLGGTAGSYGLHEVSRVSLRITQLLRNALDAGHIDEADSAQLGALVEQLNACRSDEAL